MFKPLLFGILTAVCLTSNARAATVTIEVTGQIAPQPAHIPNAPQPFALADIGLAFGDAVSFEVSFDTQAVAPLVLAGQSGRRYRHIPLSLDGQIGGRDIDLYPIPNNNLHWVDFRRQSATNQSIGYSWELDRSDWGNLRLTDVRMDFADLNNDMSVPPFLDPLALGAPNLALAEQETAYFIFNNPDYRLGDDPRSANFFVWFDIASYNAAVAPDPAPVPLPAGALLVLTGLGALAGVRVRRARGRRGAHTNP